MKSWFCLCAPISVGTTTSPSLTPKAAKQEGDNSKRDRPGQYTETTQRAPQLSEVSLLGAGTVLRLEKGCAVNGQMTKASNERVRPPPLSPVAFKRVWRSTLAPPLKIVYII